MTRETYALVVASAAVTALLLAGATPVDAQSLPLDEAQVLAELNATDGDLGFHALIDAEAWDRLTVRDPDGRVILAVRPARRLARQGLTELFFESAEPEFDELSPEEFFARFPEGRYTISGLTVDGEELESTARFRHVMPAPPDGIMVSDTAFNLDLIDCDDAVPVVAANDPFVISWDPVTQSHPELGRAGRVVVTNYQLVVEREEPTLLVFSVDLPPDVTEVEVPAGFLALGEELKFEILVRERSGNQTAVESCFAFE